MARSGSGDLAADQQFYRFEFAKQKVEEDKQSSKVAERFHSVVQTAAFNSNFLGICRELKGNIEVVCQSLPAGTNVYDSEEQERLLLLNQLKTEAKTSDTSDDWTFFFIAPVVEVACVANECPRKLRKLVSITGEGSLKKKVGSELLPLSRFLNTPLIHKLTDNSTSEEWRKEISQYEGDEFIILVNNSNDSAKYLCQRVHRASPSETIADARTRTINLLQLSKTLYEVTGLLFTSKDNSISIIQEIFNGIESEDDEDEDSRQGKIRQVKEFLQSKINGGYSFQMIGDAKVCDEQARAFVEVLRRHPDDYFLGIEKPDIVGEKSDDALVVCQRLVCLEEMTNEGQISFIISQKFQELEKITGEGRRFLVSPANEGNRRLILSDLDRKNISPLPEAQRYQHFLRLLNNPPLYFLSNSKTVDEWSSYDGCEDWLAETQRKKTTGFVVAKRPAHGLSLSRGLYCQVLTGTKQDEVIALDQLKRRLNSDTVFFIGEWTPDFKRINSLNDPPNAVEKSVKSEVRVELDWRINKQLLQEQEDVAKGIDSDSCCPNFPVILSSSR